MQWGRWEEGGFSSTAWERGGGFSGMGGGFRWANLLSRLSETLSYLPKSLVEPQLLHILPCDSELCGFRGKDALQLSWVQLAGVSGGYGARNRFRRAKKGRFSNAGWGVPAGSQGLTSRDDDSGRKKKKLNRTIRRKPFGSSGSPVGPPV